MQYQKAKSVAKVVLPHGEQLEKRIMETMSIIASIVGSTLGPGGRQVLIERQEDLPPVVTKDGVTVFRNLGFNDPIRHCILEAARDAAIRTANEAGDGTTTATILADALVKSARKYSRNHPQVSPQSIVRAIEKCFKVLIEPFILESSVKADMTTVEGRRLLEKVATVSANGDAELARAVIECFELVGDDGNVTITESSGPSAYEVERIEGYPIGMGFEDSCTKFYPKFINDPANNRVLLDKPLVIVYHGRVQDPQSLFVLLNRIGYEFEAGRVGPNVVLVATGFSESVLGYLGEMFANKSTLNVFPLLAPPSPFAQGQFEFLLDLCAVTNATLLDPLNVGLGQAEVEHWGSCGHFECGRFRSNVVGSPDEDALLIRVDELKTAMSRAESTLETMTLQERLGKLTGGIARLKVIGASNGELKEKRDRAEDAVCAVRGAIRQGCLPGGAWMFERLISKLNNDCSDQVAREVLTEAFEAPLKRLLENAGVEHREARMIQDAILMDDCDASQAKVFDCLEQKMVNAFETGILDSTPAVLEAIRNSLSIASLLGTLGGAVVFARDLEVDRQEAYAAAEWDRAVNEANERA